MKKILFGIFIFNFFLFAKPVSAHAFGKLYNLPVPFWLYLYGSGAALIISFVVIGFFLNQTKSNFSPPKKDLSKTFLFAFVSNSKLIFTLKFLSVFLFLLTIITGIFGTENSSLNFNMTFFWIIFSLGLTYFCAIFGNIYSILNPWKTLAQFLEKIFNFKIKPIFNYPRQLSYYPALVIYFLFIWLELMGQITPSQLSIYLIEYTLLNIVAIYAFGKEDWFEYGEFFSVFYKLVSKISLLEKQNNKLYLRPPFVGLLNDSAKNFSQLLFILFMLSSTAFDGFRETSTSYKFLSPFLGTSSYSTSQTISLFLSPFFFLLIYLILIYFAKLVAANSSSFSNLALKFAFTLIPIAFVYNAAHYYTLLLTQGQQIIKLISDPFGFGWNLFKSADFKPNLSLIDANITWHSQVGLILLGHIAAVFLAHLVALKIMPSHKKALISQFPMLILMVIYTMIGLWILSQPITTKV